MGWYNHANARSGKALRLETMRAMTVNCQCDGYCRSGPHKAGCECGSRDSVRDGCILGPMDLDHAPGSRGHEGQTQERRDAQALGRWRTEECLPACLLPKAWWTAWWTETQEGPPPPDPISGCEWLNRYATDRQKFLLPSEMAREAGIPGVVFQCQMTCRCMAICCPCHRNATSFRPTVISRQYRAARYKAAFMASKGFEGYTIE